MEPRLNSIGHRVKQLAIVVAAEGADFYFFEDTDWDVASIARCYPFRGALAKINSIHRTQTDRFRLADILNQKSMTRKEIEEHLQKNGTWETDGTIFLHYNTRLIAVYDMTADDGWIVGDSPQDQQENLALFEEAETILG